MELRTEAELKEKFNEINVQREFNLWQIRRPSFKSVLPFTSWLPKYVQGGWKEGLQKDLFAGLVTGIMLIPQGMAYAMTALLPPQYGFYTSISPSLVYMLLGSCPHLQAAIRRYLFLSFLLLNSNRTSSGWGKRAHQQHGRSGCSIGAACFRPRSREWSDDPNLPQRVMVASSMPAASLARPLLGIPSRS